MKLFRKMIVIGFIVGASGGVASANCSSSDIAIAAERLQDYLDDRATPAVFRQKNKKTKITSCNKSGHSISAQGTYQFNGSRGEYFELGGAMVLDETGDVSQFELTGANPALIAIAKDKARKLYQVLNALRN